MTVLDVSDLHLDGMAFQVLRDDGRHLNFTELVTNVIISDHVNTSAMEVAITVIGPVSQVLRLGAEGTTARISAPLPDVLTGKVARRELWRGFFEEVVDEHTSEGLERQITAYDPGKMMASDEEDYVFRKKSLSDIVRRIAGDFEIPVGSIPSTGRSLGNIVGRGESLWDIVQKAVQKHSNLTGEAWRVLFRQGRLYLERQGDQDGWWVFQIQRSIHSERRTRSIADLENRVKLYGNVEGELDAAKIEATVENTRSQRIYGLRQRVEYVSDEDADKVKSVARQRIDKNSIPTESIEITGWAVPMLRGGDRVQLIDSEMGISGMYYVEAVETTISPDGAESVATCVKEPVLPDLFLDELVVA